MTANIVSLNSPSVLIIGSGFGGLGMAIRLKKAGIHDFTILEKADRVGGTWRDNTYPGAACDVQSHLYSFSFEPKHDWSRKFPQQPEIHAYLQHCADKYGLAPHLRFGAEVTDAHFNSAQGRWEVHLETGETLKARVLITATGQLNRPACPQLNGIESFQGKQFHSARWDHDYVFEGKRVAVIGTGASAIQFVPQLAAKVKSLTLFQRSGAWVIPKPDRPFTALEKNALSLPLADRAYRTMIYWKNESRAIAFTHFDRALDLFSLRARWLARRHVKDKNKRRRLIPDYRIGCKRILMSNDWYQTIDQPHVSLQTDAIERVDSDAIITRDGKRHQVDAIIYGTGFKATELLSPMRISGLHGQQLNDAWQGGAEAYKGINVAGFPNLFILYGPNTNLSHNSIVFMLESQVDYVLRCLRRLEREKAAFMDVKPASQRRYVDHLQQQLAGSIWASGCNSWYINAAGKQVSNWPGFTFIYRHQTRHVAGQDYTFQPLTEMPADNLKQGRSRPA